jgi:thymidine kinase
VHSSVPRIPSQPVSQVRASATVPGVIGTCESCGRTEDVVLVRRLYVTPEAWDTPEQIVVAGEELWCFVCRTHYPHEQLEHGDAQR